MENCCLACAAHAWKSDKYLDDTGERAIVGTWVTYEVKKAIEQGYKVESFL
jgi:hypothetical protein